MIVLYMNLHAVVNVGYVFVKLYIYVGSSSQIYPKFNLYILTYLAIT